MSRKSLGMVCGLFLLLNLTGTAQAEKMVVRVYVPDYQGLYSHIQFKGTSVEIAGARPGEWYDLLLDRADLPLVLGSGLRAEVVIDDIDSHKLAAAQLGFYCSYDSLVRIMRNWAATYSNICKLDSIGPTHEGRWIYGVKISDNPQVEEAETEVLLEAMHHSREWATPQACRYFADTLLRNYATNPEFQNFINNHQIWVFPIINVDGYCYDYPNQRSWRKNRQPFGSAIGCDPNRDYNGCCNGNRMADWGALVNGSRTSHMPSSDVFFGGHGAWGKEIAALTEFFKRHTFVADVSLHSYSELVLWPYGHGEQTPDNAFYVNLGQRVAAQISRLSGGTYTPEQSNALYPANGGSCDWMYGWARHIGGFPCISFVFEIGTAFYQQTSQLDAIQREVFDGLWYLYKRSDSIVQVLEGMVPRPILAPMDSSNTGNFTIHWTPIRPEHNHPDNWELEELSGLEVVTDDIESGTGRWTLQGASQSTTQQHSGNYSIFLGTGNNISNSMVTTDPYPVQPGDSLSYWIWYNTENNYDVVTTEVSLEGKEWFQLHDRYTGNSSGWVRKVYSLAPWVGKSVFIRFRYMTDDNTLGSGVYIDDVWPVPRFTTRRTVSANITDTLFTVTNQPVGSYYYRVRGHNEAWGWGDKGPLEDIVVTGSGVALEPSPPIVTGLGSISPNPTLGGAVVNYSLGRAGPVRVAVFDATGRLVRTLVSGNAARGRYSVNWNGTDMTGRQVPAGVYYLRLSADRSITSRLVLMP